MAQGAFPAFRSFARQAGFTAPRPPREPALYHPTKRRRPLFTDADFQPWLMAQARYSGYLTERICQWWLETRRGYRRNIDYYVQAPVEAPGVNVSRDFTRVDILIPTGPGRKGAVIPGGYRNLGWDPLSYRTHEDPERDKMKRGVLADHADTWLVFIHEEHLYLDPDHVLTLALAGRDISDRSDPLGR